MADADKVNILIVDDLPEKVLVVSSVLEDLNQNIVVAHTGEEALRRVLEQDFAVILLDVNMPGMDGFETAAYVRKRRRSAHTPIIFITAYADEMHTAQGYSLGAVDYILSPVVPEILRSKVKVFVDLFRLTQQLRRQADERVALAREQAARAAAEEATRNSGFLAEASRLLASTLDFEATLRTLARLVVPFLADLGAVVRIDEQGHFPQIDVAWSDPQGEVHSRTFHKQDGLPPALAEALGFVLSTGKPDTVADLGTWSLSADKETTNGSGGSAAHEFPLASVAFLPLAARGRLLGVLILARREPEQCFGLAQLSLAENLAGRAAMSLDNARLYYEIQEGDRRKNEFLAMLAHELRNPLAPIRNSVQIMRLMGVQDAPIIQARDMIDRQVTHMARLIDDLLDMSRLSRGKILLRQERIDLVQIVRDAVQDYRSTLEAAGLSVELRIPQESIYTQGDPVRVAQMVGNILHNAGKFTDPGGTVTVTASADTDSQLAQVAIRDTGIGMDNEILARVFDAFTQADRSLDRSRGGLGLGLALVKGLVELHGGTVQAASAGPGQGTEIVIRLPLKERGSPARRPAANIPHDEISTRVLVIEDNRDTAESMRMLLSLSGHPVAVAHTGPEGIETARRFRPTVVLCDIGLPGGMDGCEVARVLRQDPEFTATYLIALTGYGQGEDRARCLEAGFDRHFTKPIDFTELQHVLAGLPPSPSTTNVRADSVPLL
jgi:signal transduction histidine kinase/DNA-binding response OmpR family regulator